MDARRYTEAEVGFRASIRLDAHDPDAHYNHGLLFWRLDRHSEAEAQFRVAAALDPTFVEAQINLTGIGTVEVDLARYVAAR